MIRRCLELDYVEVVARLRAYPSREELVTLGACAYYV